MDHKGWPDIAYTFLINHTGLIYEGVPPGNRGTHTAGHNVSGHAICLLGNFNHKEPTSEALDSLVWLVGYGAEQGWWPGQLTGGHRDTRGSNLQDCPGDHLYNLIPEINQRAEEGRIMKPPDWAITATQWHINKGLLTGETPDDVEGSLGFHRQNVIRYRYHKRVVLTAIAAAAPGTAAVIAEIVARLS